MLVRRAPWIRRAAGGLIVGAMALGACGAPGNDSGVPSRTSPSQPAPTAAASAGTSGAGPSRAGTGTPETLRFTARTVDGQRFDAAALAGKPTVLWFWAAWCPRCRAAADDVAAVHRDNAGRVNVVGVAGLRSGENQMREFVREQGIGGFPNLADDAGEVWRRFNVTTQEYVVILDRAGNVVHSGPLSSQELQQRVAALG
ncbi:MAG TPA: redoxin domain-containing protein [Micromonosporaceae bacterium]|nr:redoxin domain-containing protein [Micromonosporaceae bacterium]